MARPTLPYSNPTLPCACAAGVQDAERGVAVRAPLRHEPGQRAAVDRIRLRDRPAVRVRAQCVRRGARAVPGRALLPVPQQVTQVRTPWPAGALLSLGSNLLPCNGKMSLRAHRMRR